MKNAWQLKVTFQPSLVRVLNTDFHQNQLTPVSLWKANNFTSKTALGSLPSSLKRRMTFLSNILTLYTKKILKTNKKDSSKTVQSFHRENWQFWGRLLFSSLQRTYTNFGSVVWEFSNFGSFKADLRGFANKTPWWYTLSPFV